MKVIICRRRSHIVMRSHLILSVICALLTGCGNYFAPDRNVKEKLGDDDVIGRWKMTSKSLGLLTRDGFRSEPAHAYMISFNKDGTCLFQSVEAFVQKGRYISASGVWKLGHEVKRGSNVRVKNVIQMELNVDGGTHFRDLSFTREAGVLILWEFYGDPDQWEFIEYARDA
jgi:hypothetical protein